MPILRRILGTWRRGSRARSWPSSTTSPRVATSSRMSSLMSVDLPAPDGPTRNTKSPSGMTRSTSRRATLPLGYCFMTSCRTRTARSGTAWSRPRSRMRRRSERTADGGAGATVTDPPRRVRHLPRDGVVSVMGPRPRARQLRPRLAPRLPPVIRSAKRDRGTSAPPDDGPVRSGLEQSGGDGQVAREVGERPVPAQQDRELVEPHAGAQGGHDGPVGTPRQPQGERPARARPPSSGGRGSGRAGPRRASPGARPARPRARSRRRSARRRDRGTASLAGPPCAGTGGRPDG